MRVLTASSALRNRKKVRKICVHSGCWKKAALGHTRCNSHINEHRNESNQDNLGVKREVLSYYGKAGQLCCCWRGCSISDVDMLTLDHIENNGSEEREINRYIIGVRLYRILRRSGYPEGYQTLCSNHQLKKEMNRRRKERK